MRTITTPTRTEVRFSASEVAALGLPARGCYVSYDAARRLDDWSHWLDKTLGFEPGIDHLIQLADAAVRH